MMVTSNKSLLHHQHPEAGLVSSATHQAYIAKSAKSTKSALEICEICGGYVKDRHSLRTHFFYAHKLDVIGISYPNRQPNLQCVKCIKKFWTIEGLAANYCLYSYNIIIYFSALIFVLNKTIPFLIGFNW